MLTSAKFIILFLFAINVLDAGKAQAASLLLGMIRLPWIDPSDQLTGVIIAIDRSNRENLIHGGDNVSLEVYNYPYCNSSGCDLSASAKVSGLKDFLGNMSRFHAILLPHYEIADIIIDASRSLMIPIIDPNTVRKEDQNATHVLMFEHTVSTQISAIVRYMYMAHSCAKVGIIHENESDYAQEVANDIKIGGYETPSILALPASNVQLLNMFFGDENQKCLFFLVGSSRLKELIEIASADDRYDAAELKLFGWSHVSTSTFKINNSSKPFKNLYYPKMIPPLATSIPLTDQYMAATTAWAATGGPLRFHQHYQLSDSISTYPTPNGIMGYMRAMYIINLYAVISFATDLSNLTFARDTALQFAKSMQISVDGFPLFPALRECRPAPFTNSDCACSVVNRAVFLLGVNQTTGSPINLVDRPLLGERSLTQFSFAQETCNLPLTITSFPFRLLLLMKVGVPQSVEDAKTEGQTAIEKFFYSFVAAHNLANPAPIRPFRLITASFPTGTTAATATNASLTHEKDYDPFVILASVYPITRSRNLVFLSNAGASNIEDPVLTSRAEGWDEKALLMQPALADYIHAVAYYYSSTKEQENYTSLYVIGITQREVSLIIKSLNTFQIDVKTTAVFSSDFSVWESTMQKWVTEGGSKAFIFASALGNLTICTSLYKFVPTLGSVKVGLAGTESLLDTAITSAGLTSFPSDVDIITGSVFTETWTDNNVYTTLANQMGVKVGIMSVTNIQFSLLYLLALQLSKQSIDSTTSAAELLYTAQTVSVADLPLGPFYNETCSQSIIERNDVDRTCQCKKGLRQIRLHSFYDRFHKLPSKRAKGLVYYQTTCGVKYIPLMTMPSRHTEQLGTGALVGIVVGASVFVLITAAFIICFVVGFSGRNNRHAPKDPTKPFAIAFTDIQSSTTLWSRAPAIMSDAVEHHCTIIRKLIRQHKGYEVKTIGDSFMMAFESLENAVLFSVKIQEAFYDAEWHAEIDQHYKEILISESISRRESEIPLFTKRDPLELGLPSITFTASSSGPPNAPMDDRVYDNLWNGIRVRVGLHYGLGEVRKDPTSLGYDYFGTIVNTAARVEGVGHGGQTLLTESAMGELSDDFVNKHHITQLSLGPQNLRGLDDKIVLVQLLPSSLAGRRFPTLRLDVEKNITTEEADGTLHTTSTNDEHFEFLASRLADEFLVRNGKRVPTQSSQPSRGHEVEALELMTFWNFINTVVSTSSDRWKKDIIQHLARRWNVPYQHLNTANQRLQALMGISVRAMATLRKSSNIYNGIHNSYITQSETVSHASQVHPFAGHKESIAGHSGQRTLPSHQPSQLLGTSYSEQLSASE